VRSYKLTFDCYYWCFFS